MYQFKKFTLAVAILLGAAICNARTTGQPRPEQLAQELQHAPLLFVENRGQVADNNGRPRPDILFTAKGNSTQVYLSATGISYQFTHTIYPEGYTQKAAAAQDPAALAALDAQIKMATYKFSLTLAGANARPVVRKEKKNAYTENFYLPQCPDGIRNVSSYEKVVYENVYPNIDWVVYSNGSRLKYDFIVHPGGDPAQIKLDIKDAKKVSITGQGELLMQTSLGEVREQAPVSYANGRKIATHFRKNSDGSIGFATAAVPSGATLTIDPSVTWATYFGGAATETGAVGAIIFLAGKLPCATDASGNIYIAGVTQSATGIYSGGYQPALSGTQDLYLAKFSPAGTIIWATYYGGTGNEEATSLAISSLGDIFIGGYSTSTGLATPGAFQTTQTGTTNDMLLAKFDASGGRTWATYLGTASVVEYAGGATTDAAGNVYFVGYITSPGFGTGGSVFQNTFVGTGSTPDGFATKIDGATGLPIWFTYYGGTGREFFNGCALDASGDLYAVGNCATAGMASAGTFQTAWAGTGTVADALLVRFNGADGSRRWATYFGGAAAEVGTGCVVDGTSVYIVGLSASTSGIVPSGASGVIQSANAGLNDGFIAKFDAATASTLLWSTYFGGVSQEQFNGCTISASGDLLAVGTTGSSGSGATDAMLVKVTPAGALVWSTNFGGALAETGLGLTTSSTNIYITGNTASTSGIATTGAYQGTYGGGASDAFLTKISDVALNAITTATTTPTSLCAGATVAVVYTATGTYTAGNTFTAQLSDASGAFTTPVTIGTLTATASGTVNATIPSGTIAGTAYRIRVISNTPVVTGTDNTLNITINVLPNSGTITGTTTTVCPLAAITLADATTGGIWSSTATGIATVGTSGVVTGVAPGTTTISYTVTNTCGPTAATTIVTVAPLPNGGTITGTTTVCPLAATTLRDATTGGVWSSTATGIATVGTGGVVTAVAAGTTTISYTVTNSCGANAATAIVTVAPLPNGGSITGTPTVCALAATTLGDATAGGVWSSTAASVATVGTDGAVTGVAAGTATISYTVTNSCGSNAATTIMTVAALPDTGTITSGSLLVCVAATTSISSTVTGGVWSSTAAGIATVGTNGAVTGVAAGTATISYTASNSCGIFAATRVVTVNPLPDTGAITGALTVCELATTALGNIAPGGTWSSAATGIATVGTSGIVSGIAPGTATISYTASNSCGTLAATKIVTVQPLPNAGTITGTTTVCVLSATTLADATTGGTWSNTSAGIATVGTNGAVSGLAAGTATISYTITNGCGAAAATTIVSVMALPNAGTITGTTTVCALAATTLSDAATGGVWSSTATAIATTGTGGTVTGVAAGTTTISYTVANGCGTAAATAIVTVTAVPSAGTISGSLTVCPATTATLTDGVSGGTWSSAATGIATIGTDGVVTGISGGTATISYTINTTCGSTAATAIVTVDAAPFAGSIGGLLTICPTATSLLTDATAGGAWSSTDAGVATIDGSGLVSAVAPGTATISYTVTAACGIAAATVTMTVEALPATGAISGTLTICAGNSTLFTETETSGTWSSAATTVATVGTDGTVTGLAAGTASIAYTLSNSCGAAATAVVVTVNPLPNAGTITGPAALCELSTTTLADAAAGGVWSSDAAGVATIGITGIVTAVTPGTTTISYTFTNICGIASTTRIVTVNQVPLVYNVTGGGSYCAGSLGSRMGLDNATAGISYRLYRGAALAVTATGTGTALDFGYLTASGTYTVLATNTATGCNSAMTGFAAVTMTPTVTASVGMVNTSMGNTTCSAIAISYIAMPVNGGSAPVYSWSVNGSVMAAGLVPTFNYMPANGDIVRVTLTSSTVCAIPASVWDADTMTVIDSRTPVVHIDASANSVCAGLPVTITATPAYGGAAPSFRWTKNGINAGTSASYSYTPANGDVLICTMRSNYVCRLADSVTSNDVTMSVITAMAPAVSIVASPGLLIIAGQPDTLTAIVTGSTAHAYQWFLNGTAVPGATNAVYAGIFHNNDSVSCTVTNTDACGLASFNAVTLHVHGTGISDLVTTDISLYPDPNKGTFMIKGSWPSAGSDELTAQVYNLLGQKVYQQQYTAQQGKVELQVTLGDTLPNGVYILYLNKGAEQRKYRFVKVQ